LEVVEDGGNSVGEVEAEAEVGVLEVVEDSGATEEAIEAVSTINQCV
jgi:hypothetical protein